MARHRHQEFLRFLNTIERAVPADKAIHVILDNYGSHKHPTVLKWLARHPRFTFHFTPTPGSWLNAVETFLSALNRRRLKRGSFPSIVDLQAAINRYIAEHNDDPKPFTWTKSPSRPCRQCRPRQGAPETPARRPRVYTRSAIPTPRPGEEGGCAGDPHHALIRLRDANEDMHERGFARAVLAHQRVDPALLQSERDAI
jgi:transposase